jgi:hypothetical protein
MQIVRFLPFGRNTAFSPLSSEEETYLNKFEFEFESFFVILLLIFSIHVNKSEI